MGPLSGVKVIEMAGIGPGPFCGMLLADLGAEVIRIDRVEASGLGVAMEPDYDVLNRGKRSVALDLKRPDGTAIATKLIASADLLIEGFRPGVMERMGLGPSEMAKINPRLVYGRMTGWGQHGPLAQSAGHDLNYIAVTGALDAIGPADGPPAIPLNLVGDFAGGSLYLAVGLLAALTEARTSGRGQVVDAAIVDGVSHLMSLHNALRQMGNWTDARANNLIDGGAPFYNVYETSDGRYVSIGAIEPKFFADLVTRMELEAMPPQYDRPRWPEMKRRFEEAFKTRTQADWCELLEGSDACFAPVLTAKESAEHPHNRARANMVTIGPLAVGAPAPRFSATPSPHPSAAVAAGKHSASILVDLGVAPDEVQRLAAAGIILQA